ncbi:hypothetical protein HU200_063032 [Digitaria exilis]|uniref:Uncharacterized protein n=1 Tax=Digitaria exilis TaxID=1010633 RepID=A0A835A831_9POAL|nr:hypothetical protein HU200_063032 [Digitaria exilis]
MPFFFEFELVRFDSEFSRRHACSMGAMAASLSTASCAASEEEEECRDEAAALGLKMVAVAAILVSSATGVAIPLLGRRWRRRGSSGSAAPSSSSGGGLFVLAKAFAAGVILATGFVHVLPDADEALNDPCLPAVPWRRFPFPGFVAMLAALGTLVVDFVGTHMCERRRRSEEAAATAAAGAGDGGRGEMAAALLLEDGELVGRGRNGVERRNDGGGRKEDDGMHSHSHAHGHGGASFDGHGHGHRHGDDPSQSRHAVVAQVLELGIVSHSAQFKSFSALLMAFFFAITTSAGIIVGAGIASFYNPNSPRALVVEGILDAMSAGILIYMALVDLIAADFLSKRMSCNPRLQVGSYIALFLGAMAMASLAIWV